MATEGSRCRYVRADDGGGSTPQDDAAAATCVQPRGPCQVVADHGATGPYAPFTQRQEYTFGPQVGAQQARPCMSLHPAQTTCVPSDVNGCGCRSHPTRLQQHLIRRLWEAITTGRSCWRARGAPLMYRAARVAHLHGSVCNFRRCCHV